MSEQKRIGEVVQAKKFDEDKKNPAINKSYFNEKRKKWVNPFSQKGYLGPTVREIFENLKDAKIEDKDFISTVKFIKRCVDKYEKGTFDAEGNDSTSKYQVVGAVPPSELLKSGISSISAAV